LVSAETCGSAECVESSARSANKRFTFERFLFSGGFGNDEV
jgi:hypothetical protein